VFIYKDRQILNFALKIDKLKQNMKIRFCVYPKMQYLFTHYIPYTSTLWVITFLIGLYIVFVCSDYKMIDRF